MRNLENKVVWITGASSGLGEAMVYRMAKENCRVILSSNEPEKLEAVAKQAGLAADRSLIIPLELENFNADEAVQKIKDKFGGLDILINNAGICQKDYFENTKESIERKLMEINYFAMVKLSRACLGELKKSKGMIAAVASLNGRVGAPMLTTYAASKFATIGFFESLRYELYQSNVHVLIIIPGFMKTDITIKSLTGDGSSYGKNSITNEIGMPVDKCASIIAKAIKKNKPSVRVGRWEHLFPVIRFVWPGFHYWLFRKMHKI